MPFAFSRSNDDHRLFEKLSLEGFQCGLSRRTFLASVTTLARHFSISILTGSRVSGGATIKRLL
jgi:hypothetical protein